MFGASKFVKLHQGKTCPLKMNKGRRTGRAKAIDLA